MHSLVITHTLIVTVDCPLLTLIDIMHSLVITHTLVITVDCPLLTLIITPITAVGALSVLRYFLIFFVFSFILFLS